ncbi:MAG TPA: alpha/beta hydrolase-fold protein, partial [Pyrinomonadaceae bacterium]|nr:alpha/beta hydrolase-fold protein [Pyrinomonadaceae bacterium]
RAKTRIKVLSVTKRFMMISFKSNQDFSVLRFEVAKLQRTSHPIFVCTKNQHQGPKETARLMRLLSLALLSVLALAVVNPCSAFVDRRGSVDQGIKSPTIRKLAADLAVGRRNSLEVFWRDLQGKAPLIEPIPGNPSFMFVTFVWHGDAATKSVTMRGGPPTSLVELPLSRLVDSDLWYRTVPLPRDARFTYYLRVNAPRTEVVYETAESFNDDYPPRVDPLNPHTFEGSSVLEMPNAPPQKWAVRQPNTPAGTISQARVNSRLLNEEREIDIYTPPGYNATGGSYSLLIMFDAELYTTIDLPITLDNLISAKRIPPTVAVLVHNSAPFNRRRDLSCYPPFADFVATELMVWIQRHYRVRADARGHTIGGASLGGLTACYIGLRHSNVFGNVLSQSGSLGTSLDAVRSADKPLSGMELALAESYSTEPDWLIRQFMKSKRLPLHFYLEAQRYDVGLYGADILAANRHLRDVLLLKGYRLTYREFNGGHDGYSQRGTVAGALLALLNS